MADIIRYIGGADTGSGDWYSTWSAWLAAIPADISAATGTGDNWIGKGRDGSYNETLSFSTKTTDSGGQITLTYDTGAELVPGQSRDVSGVGVQIYNSASSVLSLSTNYISVIGLDIKNTNATANLAIAKYGTPSAGANLTTITDCILHNTGTTGTGYVIGVSTTNSVIDMSGTISYGKGRILDCRSAATMTVDSSVFYCSDNQQTVLNGTELTITNSYAGNEGALADFAADGGSPSGSNNATSDTTATTYFTSSLASKAAASQFVSVTVGTEDFNLLVTSDLIGAGIAGIDIGAIQYVAGGATISSIDSPVLDGEQNNAFTYSNYTSGEPDSITIKTAGSEYTLDVSSGMTASGGSGTFDMPNVSGYTSEAGTAGIPFDTASWTPKTVTLSNGTESDTDTIVVNEDANWHVVEVDTPLHTIGYISYVTGGWDFATPVNTDQYYYYSTNVIDDQAADYLIIGANGQIDTNIEAGSSPFLFFDATDGKWYYDTIDLGAVTRTRRRGFITGVGKLGLR